LYILLIVIFFPLMDLLFIGMQFCCAWYANHEFTHELSVSRYADWTSGAAFNQVLAKFNATGIPQFIKIVPGKNTNAYSYVPPNSTTGLPAQVFVTTTIQCAPWLTIPLPVSVTGLNKNMTISFTAYKVWETYNPNDPGVIGPSGSPTGQTPSSSPATF
jgi:hypothetical protein